MQNGNAKARKNAWAKPTLLLVRGLVLTAVLYAVCGCADKRRVTGDCAGVRNVLCFNAWNEYVGDGTGVWVSVAGQEVRVVEGRQVVQRYRCSTALAGVGCVKDSGRTPVGWHRVAAKIGGGLPAGAVLKEREWTGEVWENPKFEFRNSNLTKGDKITPPPRCAGLPLGKGESFISGDLILSRILWLEGMEEGRNKGGDVDTFSRYIYIHGTNRTDELGVPASAGCIRMDPAEVIELFDAVEEGCLVLITND